MSKRVIGVMAAALLLAFVVFAGDVWKDKKYTDWDQKDVAKILTDSPWARTVQFGGQGSSQAAAAPIDGIGTANSNVGADSSGGGGASDGSRASHSLSATQSVIQGNGGSGMGPQANFSVLWYSSRTIREALAREKELQGVAADEAEKPLATQFDHYTIVLQGRNLGGFVRAGEDAIKDKSYLMLKKSHDKLEPDKVTLQKSADGARVTAILYEFPEKNATGQPTIASDEKSADFVTELRQGGGRGGSGDSAKQAEGAPLPIKVTFDLSKMSDAQGKDM
jgi:hypothetical protein